jgi:hypothetical protein
MILYSLPEKMSGTLALYFQLRMLDSGKAQSVLIASAYNLFPNLRCPVKTGAIPLHSCTKRLQGHDTHLLLCPVYEGV